MKVINVLRIKGKRKIKDDFIDKLNEADLVENDETTAPDLVEWLETYIKPVMEKVLGKEFEVKATEDKLEVVGISDSTLERVLTYAKLVNSKVAPQKFTCNGKVIDTAEIPSKSWYSSVLLPSLNSLLGGKLSCSFNALGDIVISSNEEITDSDEEKIKEFIQDFNEFSVNKLNYRVCDEEEKDLPEEDYEVEFEETEDQVSEEEPPVEDVFGDTWINEVLIPAVNHHIDEEKYDSRVTARNDGDMVTVFIEPKEDETVEDSAMSVDQIDKVLDSIGNELISKSKLPLRLIYRTSKMKRNKIKLK